MAVPTDVIAGVLVVVFIAAGSAKLAGARPLVADFARFGYPQWSCPAVGLVEVTGAALQLVRIVDKPGAGLTRADLTGAALLGLVMVGAVRSHIRCGDPMRKVASPLVLLLLIGTEVALRASR
jgi:hypothetical protein